MAGRSNRAGGFLLPLAIVLTLALGARFVRAQSALINAAESVRSNADTAPSTESAAKNDVKLSAVFHTTRVDLDWECPVADVTQFRIKRTAHGSHTWTELRTVSGTVISFSDTQAKSVDFDYRVIALGEDGTVLATSSVVQASKTNILAVLHGGKIAWQDFLDIGVWQDTSTPSSSAYLLVHSQTALGDHPLRNLLAVLPPDSPDRSRIDVPGATSIPAFVTCSAPSSDGRSWASHWSSPAIRSAFKSPHC